MTEIINNVFEKSKESKKIELIWFFERVDKSTSTSIRMEKSPLFATQFEVVELLQKDFRNSGLDLIMCYDKGPRFGNPTSSNQSKKRFSVAFFLGYWNDGIL